MHIYYKATLSYDKVYAVVMSKVIQFAVRDAVLF